MGLKGNLYHTTQINFEYNTNHIEGSTLTEEQTRYIYETNTLVLEDGNGRVGRIIMFKECLKNNIVPFIILDKDKLFYYRGLNEYQYGREEGYLIDTCLNAQDQYQKLIEKFIGNLRSVQ